MIGLVRLVRCWRLSLAAGGGWRGLFSWKSGGGSARKEMGLCVQGNRTKWIAMTRMPRGVAARHVGRDFKGHPNVRFTSMATFRGFSAVLMGELFRGVLDTLPCSEPRVNISITGERANEKNGSFTTSKGFSPSFFSDYFS